jgi:hypothetical protein
MKGTEIMNSEQLESLYNSYMDESAAYADRVVASDFVMSPPSLEEMKNIIGREKADQGFREQSSTIIRHQFSNYDAMIRALPTPDCESRFKYLVYKIIKKFAQAHYRMSEGDAT